MKIKNEKLMKGDHIQVLRELLGLGVVDLYWFAGTGIMNSTWKLTGEERERPILDPSLSILVRFLSRYPELSFMPKFPNFFETFEKITQIYPTLFQNKKSKEKTSVRRFAPLFGKNSWSSPQWEAGESPSPVVLRLFYLVTKAIENEGIEGLKKYLAVVEEEAQGRGIDNNDILLSSGVWKTQTFRDKVNEMYGDSRQEGSNQQNKDGSDNNLMKGADIQALRELLGLGVVDIYWLAGTGSTNNSWKLTGEESERPILDPSLGILVRFLAKFPELSYMPRFPDFFETFEKIARIYPGLFQNKKSKEKTSVRRFAPLFGKNSWSSSQWEAGESPSAVVSRLFYLVMKAIEQEGEEGLKKYLAVVEEEAQTRGIKDMDSLLSSGVWRTKSFQAQVKIEYGEPIKRNAEKTD